MSFEQAVRQTPLIAGSFLPGLQALKNVDRGRVQTNEPRKLRGSIDLDSALAEALPNAPRWDYAVGYPVKNNHEVAIWIEVHPASSTSVTEVINKVAWLKHWLSENSRSLESISYAFVWIATGSVAFSQNSPQQKRLAAKGVRFVGSILHIERILN